MERSDEEPPLTLSDAVWHIDRATAFAEPLRRRAEGVTIALWGFVSACVVLSSGVVESVLGLWDAGGWLRFAGAIVPLPWAILGILGTLAVWRIAEISARTPIPGRRRSPGAILGWLGALVALIALIVFVVPSGAAGVALALFGVAWASVGAADVYRATPVGRRTLVGVGATIVLAGAVYGVATSGSADDGWHAFPLVAALAAGVVPIVGGLAQALRG